jgi:putative FmdB family regulatory protein
MPIYEYECRKCGDRFERIQKFSDRVVRTCPECKGRVDRLVHAPAIQFKGTGWYVNDYSDKGKNPEPADSDAKGDRADKSEPQKESKGKSDAATKPTSDKSSKKTSTKGD